ncbi:MAG: hypothetical protein CMH30_07725 [Micavibrio sp.]|nr:hypothetical protein [Micavibrio sp.]
MTEEYNLIALDMVKAAFAACDIIRADFEKALNGQIIGRNAKSLKNNLPDFVTETDQKAEDIIKSTLSSLQPDIAFVGEECGGDLSQNKFFLVDPLDGTSNFSSLRDYFAVCAAYVENGQVKAAVIADPIKGDAVYASKEGGTYLNGVRVNLDDYDCEALRQTQLECEVPFSNIKDLTLISKLLPAMSGMRKSGSTALDILNLIKGRNIICLSSGLEPHDIAACTLIVSEANGQISEISGQDITIHSKTLIAAPTKKYKAAMSLLS